VRLARWLARRGLLAARFDHSGVGDSRVRQDRIPWNQSTVLETREVMNELGNRYGAQRFVLIGTCSGAVTAFKTAHADPRVAGVVLLNSQPLDPDDSWNKYVQARALARRHRSQPRSGIAFWRKPISTLSHRIRPGASPSKQVRSVTDRLSSQLGDLVDRGTRCLIVHTVGDPSEDYFDVILGDHRRRLQASGRFEEVTVARADHTFTLLGSQTEVLQIIENWMKVEWMEAADETA
jgi:pimeloyl-ACP methyl ester carboxylesterase